MKSSADLLRSQARVTSRGVRGGRWSSSGEESGPSGGDRGNPLPRRTTVVALAASGPPRLPATNRTQGELPGWRCVGFRSSGVPRLPTAITLGPCQQCRQPKCCPLCAMSSRGQLRLSGVGGHSVPRLLPCRQPPPPRAPSPPTQAQDGDVRAGSTATGREVFGRGCRPTLRRWNVVRDGR